MSEESTQGAFTPGQELGEQFLVDRKLGDSDGGEVYLVQETSSGRDMVLKVLKGAVSEGTSYDELRAEVKQASVIKHKNLVRVFGLGRESDSVFLVMEYVEGQSLAERVAKRRATGRSFSSKVVFNIIAHICNALQRVHETTAHGSLTLGNIYLTSQSKVKISNMVYGRVIARALSPLGQSVFHDSPFVAPEVRVSGGESLSPSSDIYALALMTMELLSPKSLGDSHGEVLANALEMARERGEGLAALLEEATAQDPAARLDSAGTFRERLKATIDGDPKPARPESPPEPAEAAAPESPEPPAESPPSEPAEAPEEAPAPPPEPQAPPAPAFSFDSTTLEPEGEPSEDDPFARAAAVLGRTRESSLEMTFSEADVARGETRYLVSRDGLDYGPYTREEVIDQLHKDEINENTLILDRVTQERMPMRSMSAFSKAVREYIPVREERRRIKQEQREAVVQTAKTAGRWTAYSGVALALLFGLGFLVYWNVFRPTPVGIPEGKLLVDLSSRYKMLPPPTEFEKVQVDNALLAAIFNEGGDEPGPAGRGGRGGRGGRRGGKGAKGGKGGKAGVPGGNDENISYIDASTDSGTNKILTQQDINSTIRARFGSIAGCIRQEIKRNPSFKGVTVQFFVRPTGTTGGVKIVEGRYNSSPVGSCLKARFSSMRFPKHGGLNKGVQYPIYVK